MKIDTCLILAAGLGSRLQELTKTCPKPLIDINGIPLFERTLQLLKQRLPDAKIFVAVGYQFEKFTYLVDKYKLNLIYIDKFAVTNNIVSMSEIKKYASGNVLVFDADILLTSQFFDTLQNTETTGYFCSYQRLQTSEWMLTLGNDMQILDCNTSGGCDAYELKSVSVWQKHDFELLSKQIDAYLASNENATKQFWDNAVFSKNPALPTVLYGNVLEDSNDCFEIDNIDDLTNARSIFK